MSTTTCGDFGGTTRAGEPCGRPRRDATCQDHGPDADAKLQELKRRFLEAMENGTGTVQAAAQSVGVDQATIWRHRQADPDFDAEVEDAFISRDRKRLDLHAESLFMRVMKGEAAATLEIFWMVNTSRRLARATGGEMSWQDLRRLEITGPDGRPIEITEVRVDVPDRTSGKRPAAESGRPSRLAHDGR